MKLIFKESERKVKSIKKELILRCLKVRELFNISFESSLYFDKSIFENRAGNIFGISDDVLDQFKVILDKQEEKKKKQKEDGQLSFRGGSTSNIDSIRSSLANIITPIKAKKQSEYGIVPSFDIAKVLMRGRQTGGQETPKGDSKHIAMIGQLKLIKNKEQTIEGTKRSESIEYDHQEVAMGQVQSITKRKNSVRRQFYVLKRSISKEQEEENKSKQINKEGGSKLSGFHKKNVMSVNTNGLQGSNGLMFQNQRVIDNNQIQKQQASNLLKGPPPGLPKGGQTQKKGSKQSQRNQKDQVLEVLFQRYEKRILRQAFDKLNKNNQPIQSSLPQVPEQFNNSKLKSSLDKKPQNQSFNLLFIKFEGNNYTVQNAQELFKATQKPNIKSDLQTNITNPMNIDQQENKQKHQSISISQTAKLMKSKPFEIIRVGNNELGGQMNEKSDKNQEERKVKQRNQGQQNVQKTGKITSKEQYQNFIQKFKQISEKIEKVQKDANQLNQEYSKYN